MPDWKKLVEERLGSLNLPPSAKQEIVAELAAHLEDVYEAAQARGLDATASLELALQEIQDGPVLLANIHRAHAEEDLMNLRTRSLWLPPLAIFFASTLFLLA